MPNPTSGCFISTNVFNVLYPLLKPSGIPLILSLVSCSPSMLIRIPTLGNSLQSAIILSVKYPLVEITTRSDFLYNSLTISGRSLRINGSPPVILVKAISGSFFIVSNVISSSGLVGSLKQSHILQWALHLYVTITVPYRVLLLMLFLHAALWHFKVIASFCLTVYHNTDPLYRKILSYNYLHIPVIYVYPPINFELF